MATTPHSVSGTLIDQDGVPVSGALVYIRDEDGALATIYDDQSNPLETNSLGEWETVLLPGDYYLTFVSGCSTATETLHVCQEVERVPFITELDILFDLSLLDGPGTQTITNDFSIIGELVEITVV